MGVEILHLHGSHLLQNLTHHLIPSPVSHGGGVDPNPSEAVTNQVDSIAVVSSASPVAPSGVSPDPLVLPTRSFQLVLTRSLQLVPTRSLPLELVPTRFPTRSGPVELFPVQSVLVPAHLISGKLIPILFILVEQSIQFHSFPVQIIPMQCFPVGLFLVPSTLVWLVKLNQVC